MVCLRIIPGKIFANFVTNVHRFFKMITALKKRFPSKPLKDRQPQMILDEKTVGAKLIDASTPLIAPSANGSSLPHINGHPKVD